MTQEPAIEITPDTVMAVLRTMEGAGAGLRAGQLVEVITGRETSPMSERTLRAAITELRMRGHPACATPDHGYFWGVTEDEIWDTVRNLTRRSLTGLTQASRMTGQTVQELAGQLQLELEEAHYEADE